MHAVDEIRNVSIYEVGNKKQICVCFEIAMSLSDDRTADDVTSAESKETSVQCVQEIVENDDKLVEAIGESSVDKQVDQTETDKGAGI